MTPASEAGTQSNFARSMRNIVADADQLLKETVKSGDGQFAAVRDELSQQLRRMRVQLDEIEDTAVAKARQAARATDDAVRTHPYTAIGIGAAAGLLIGVLLARR
jgi:ElaB/YqjD/DUF883 family membrane-anchored ribosome-binding protein